MFTAICSITVVFAALLFYVLTIIGIFVLRAKRPDAERPYRAFGYPFVPMLYVLVAAASCCASAISTQTAGAGLVIVLIGLPVYLLWFHGWSRRTAQAGRDGIA